MKKIYVPMIRYGDKEFDEGFLGWGFQGYEEQVRAAKGVLNLVNRPELEILDMGCGIGSYHSVWLEEGHTVTGIDLSETFIFMANSTNGSNPKASYRVENIYDLNEHSKYDVVTLIDTPLEDEDMARVAFAALKKGGAFIFQVDNPEYSHSRGSLNNNARTWKQNDDQTFLLTRNEYNEDIDRWEYEEWHVDIEKEEIIVEHNFSRNFTFTRLVDILLTVGFVSVNFLDHSGRPYGTEHGEVKHYFCCANKGNQD